MADKNGDDNKGWMERERNQGGDEKRQRKWGQQKKGDPWGSPYKKLAATYFSTNKCSIIGDVRLNFTLSAEPTPSARNGKR